MPDSLQASQSRTDTAAGKQARLALVAVGGAAILIGSDLFIMNLAFASISADFAFASPATMAWVLNGYTVVFAALLIPAGRLADRFGRRALFRIGLSLFGLGALAAAVAPSVVLLIMARGLQGTGAALFVPTGMALLLASAPPDRHQRMMAAWTAIGSVAAAGGPILGGFLTQFHWRWIFVISVPIVLISLASSRALPETSRSKLRLPDWWGSLLLIAGVGTSVAAISHANTWGIGDPKLLGLVAIVLASMAWFVWRSARHPVPAFDLGAFRHHPFRWATIGMATYFIGFGTLLLGCSLIVTRAWGLDPIVAGLMFSIGPGSAGVSAVVVGRSRWRSGRLALVGSLIIGATGLLLLVTLGAGSESMGWFILAMLMSGVGAGAGQVGFMTAGVNGLPAADYAMGMGMINTCRQIGTAIGVAVFVALVGTSAVAADFHPAWIAVSVASLIAAFAAIMMSPKSPSPSVAS